MVNIQLIEAVAKADAGTREVAKVILSLYDEMGEIRDLANKLNNENNRAIQEIASLRKDKAALTAFIVDNVTDETKLNEIFKGEK